MTRRCIICHMRYILLINKKTIRQDSLFLWIILTFKNCMHRTMSFNYVKIENSIHALVIV